jgi:hypothetical protein
MAETTSELASVSGNTPVGVCCCCDYYDSHGKLVKHVDHYQMFRCKCGHWACKEHFISGLCYGCYVEEVR